MIWVIVAIALGGVVFGYYFPFGGLLGGVLASDLIRVRVGIRHRLMFGGFVLGCCVDLAFFMWIVSPYFLSGTL